MQYIASDPTRSSPGYSTVLTMPCPSTECLERMWQRLQAGQPPCPRDWCSDDAQAILPSARRSAWGWLLWLGLLAVLWLWLQSSDSVGMEPTVAGGAAKLERNAGTAAAAAHPISSLAPAVTPASSLDTLASHASEREGDTAATATAVSVAPASVAPLTPAANIAALKSHARNTVGARLASVVAGAAAKKPFGLPPATSSSLSLKSKLSRRKRMPHDRRRKHPAH